MKDKTTEEMEIMQTEMNSRKVNIYNALENLFQKFMNDSKEKFKKYTNLLESNAQDSRLVDETLRKIARTKERIRATVQKIYQMQKEFEEKNGLIASENHEIQKNFLELKARMHSFRNAQRSRLGQLSTYSKESIDKLQRILKLGESILRNAEVCRRLEFEHEKVLPFYESSQQEDLTDDDIREQNFEKDELVLLKRCDRFRAFRNFFKKYNKVLLDKLAAEKELGDEEKRNKQLKSTLAKYLEGLTVNAKTLQSRSNPLLTS